MKLQKGPAIAIGSFAFISLWMLSGIFSSDDKVAIEAPVKNESDTLFSVQVERFHAKSITPELIIHGETAPSSHVLISSEVAGKVTAIHHREGDFVKKGQLILEIDPKGKVQQLNQAKAVVKQKTLEHKANKSLIGKGLQNETRLAASEAELEAAKAQLELLTIELAATKIRAPFSGILENRQVEVGSYLRSGDPIIEVMDFNPFIIKSFAAEKDLHLIKPGIKAFGKTLDGKTMEGRIRYVSSTANKASRTFAVELEIPNPSERQADGVTANISIPLDATDGVFISPALLSLNENGLLGAKLVNNNQEVEFAPVQLVKAEAQGVWVSGLPNPADLIVVGQSFVSAGEKVNPVFKTPIAPEGIAKQATADNAQTSEAN
ncbi:MAG: efflux RND transporter periplasmic adaptor subunit [Gammaproteobacteria bacterium]|nr:efflux RND transporter periplasmic adaptor subunit [Gammaproteobacteria bacterium]